MESTDRSWEDQRQFEVLMKPDATRPDFTFRDGDFDVMVETAPAACPVWLLYRHSGFGLLDLLWLLPMVVVVSKVDDRSKVVTFRQPKRRPSVPRVVGLEFCQTEEAADARRVELLRTWQPGQSVGAVPISARTRGRVRRAG